MTKLHHGPYVLSSFLDQFPELVMARGANLATLSKAADIPLPLLTGRHQLIPFDNFIGILEVAAESLDYPEIAIDLAGRQTLNSIGPMSRLLVDCTSLKEAYAKILEYFRLLVFGFDIRLIETSDCLELAFDINMPTLINRQQFQNYLLASTVCVTRRLVGEKFPLRGCFYSRSEPDLNQQKKHAAFFGCPIAFDAPTVKLTMDSAILHRQIDKSIISNSLNASNFVKSVNLEEAISNIFVSTLPTGYSDLATVASSLGYSTRTLKRRLAERSLSFSSILDSIRLSQANQYLQSTCYQLSDIAVLLGYKNQSAFTRAYIRLCGITPSEYRDRF
ncbi:AraC family transcriptional regulator ligand-binding domain-containing protein [Alteromonas sp. MMG017]|uniref:AraC family transcriptional regulator n=1 Tax=Alteromonas sp. MMG017 TaxID=2822692 RepID=UPI001B3A7A12|nr:AraC family transcriptional regulator [Alteromonas sp. MMG017]MBQ4831355.1 AraC family transcriptional regulator ligand-binding domain-containing protein [Alteromonas sp. MMG017]